MRTGLEASLVSCVMEISVTQLKTFILGMNLATAEEFDQVLKTAEEKGLPILDYLPESGLITDNHLGQLLASMFQMSYVDLSQERITKEMLELLPEIVARSQEAVIFRDDEKGVHLATTNPNNYEFFKMIERRFNKKVVLHYVTPTALRGVFRQYGKSFGEKIQKVLDRLKTVFRDEDVVIFVSLLLSYAHASRASDIHLEPLTDHVSVRFRVDGVLHELARYPLFLHEKVVFRLKIMSRLRTDDHASPQDGRFSFSDEPATQDERPETFDIRLSVLPVTHGENVVMRILAEQSQRFSLTDIGFSSSDLEKVAHAARKPYGMILSVGPTGAGKTTTLYAILQTLNTSDVNIMTIEDPVEYAVDHVQQTQVNEKKKLTFATGLRSIVRQDPDIILVGEIRDNETASIAINAAMTGHLVLSTLHSNDASTTFPRLVEMDIEPFLIASSINVIVAQRLTRRICERCRTNYFLEADELALLNAEPELAKLIKKFSGKKDIKKIRFYRGAKNGCKLCGDTGYSGRVGIFEVMEVTDGVRALITQRASADVITKEALRGGMKSMVEDGIEKVLQGLTTLEEIIRATKT